MLRPHPLAGACACGVRAGRCGLVWLFQKSRLRHGLWRPGQSTSASASASSRRPGLRCLSLCPKQEANSAQCGDRKDRLGSAASRGTASSFSCLSLYSGPTGQTHSHTGEGHVLHSIYQPNATLRHPERGLNKHPGCQSSSQADAFNYPSQ